MKELFRLKIASKRQATIPQRLLNLLHLAEGDEIRIEVEDGLISRVEPCKVVPTKLFTRDVLHQLATREREMEKEAVHLQPSELSEDEEERSAVATQRMASAR
jgi:bifunctional DNA-binding transcriptional regulator/antitoxin component of YhaV-PrlF toxin-antitoxin module